jgi:hypothetical protein
MKLSEQSEPEYLSVTDYGLNDQRFIPGSYRDFSFRHHIQTGFGSHLNSFPSSGYQRHFRWGVKWPEHEADRSPPPNAEVKKGWKFVQIFHDLMLKHSVSFTVFILYAE